MSKHLVLLINSYAKYFLIYILILTGLHKRLVFNRQQNREILLGSTFTSLCSCCIFSSYLLIIQSQKKKKKKHQTDNQSTDSRFSRRKVQRNACSSEGRLAAMKSFASGARAAPSFHFKRFIDWPLSSLATQKDT